MKKKVQKPKPYDRSTITRLRKEAQCFDLDHKREIVELHEEVKEAKERAVKLTEQMENMKAQMADMIDKHLAEEEKKTARAEAYHEGSNDREEVLKKEKACFVEKHQRYEHRHIMPLSFGATMNLFFQIRKKSMVMGGEPMVMVMVPEGIDPMAGLKGNPFDDIMESLRDMKDKGFI